MNSSNVWYQEIMTQKFSAFPNKNLIKLIIVYSLLNNGKLNGKTLKNETLEYIYRFYIDNTEEAKYNPSLLIRNIHKYGLDDIIPVLDEALFSWKDDFPDGCLNYDKNYIYLDIENVDSDPTLFTMTKKILDMLYTKYAKEEFDYNPNFNNDSDFNSDDLSIFGSSRFRNRCLEDIQYCPLCEESDLSKLLAVRILDKSKCSNGDLTDKNNGIILCENHAKLYKEKKFKFNARGYLIINENNDLLDYRMHLSQKVLNEKRREYIIKSNQENF